MSFTLSQKAQDRLTGVHPDLIKVVRGAMVTSPLQFTILEGVRSLARQEQLVKAGASTTMKSRHLTGHAVDLGAMVNGNVRFDWPLYYKLAEIIKGAATDAKIPIEWGGDWKTFPDGPHFQLPWSAYP